METITSSTETLEMNLNSIIHIDETFDSGGVTEPVTLSQVKEYLRLGGFDSDDSGEQPFDYDDGLITAMITEARMWVEKYTGIYIVMRTLSVLFLNQAGSIELPGPIVGSIAFTDKDGNAITDFDTVGTSFPKIITCNEDRVTAIYTVGYAEYPEWVTNSMLAYIAWSYENRGDEQNGSPERAAAIARPHRRVRLWG